MKAILPLTLYCCCTFYFCTLANSISAEVISSDKAGFELRIATTVNGKPLDVYQTIHRDFNQWWDGAHSVSGKAENLSIDFEKGCFLEKMPGGGFVRHAEIVRHIPGQQLRMRGGLGPLQQMAVTASFTIDLKPGDKKDTTKIEVYYNVGGYTKNGLKALAPIVDRVLSEQIDRLEKHVNGKK